MALQVWADLPPKNVPYTLRSKNNNYYLRSIPYSLVGTMGKTYVYNVRTGHLIYTMDVYLDNRNYLSDDGLSITSVSYWGGHNMPANDSLIGRAINFYNSGQKVKTYQIMDLVKHRSNLDYTVSHAIWKYSESSESYYDKKKREWIHPDLDSLQQCMARNNAYQSNDTLYITTVEKKVFIFYIPTGKLTRTANAVKFFRKKGSQFTFINPPREILPGYEGPLNSLPNLTGTTTSFAGSLTELLKYKPVGEAYNCNILTRFTLLVDKETGEFEVTNISAWKKLKDQPDDRGNINFTDEDLIKQKILTWLKDKKFDTKDFPSWVEKWKFDEEYYFTFQ